ncbi:MAG TPA: lipopolysaccharide assembly protein LapA domain-containing protein [Ideonella sp.]|nr:lipopolysaccharide assembly protein LapA domain-containing protein [Ideonella sp.]
MRIFVWLARALVFFALFAFALNNQQDAAVHWFFGREWHAPMVFIVLAAFALGCAFGVFAMVPAWWRHRRAATRQRAAVPAIDSVQPPFVADEAPLEHPPRDGL